MDLFSYENLKNSLLRRNAPAYIYDKKTRIITNLTHLFVIFFLFTSNDILLKILSILYIATDLPWHNWYNSESIKLLNVSHSYIISFFIIYVFIKIMFGYFKKRNITIFIPIIIYFFVEHLKGYFEGHEKLITNHLFYQKYMNYEPLVHTVIWLGLTFLHVYYPEFNLSFI